MMKKITTNRTIRQLALQMFKGRFFEAFLIVVMVEVFTSVPAFLINFFAPQSEILAWISNGYVLLVSGPLYFGLAIYFLCNFREQRIGLNALVHGFEFFAKSASIYLSYILRIVLGTILFVIPGIIVAINYSQALFILVDNPGKSVSACFAESKAMMKGNHFSYISFYFSYIGWFVLASVPVLLLSMGYYNQSIEVLSDPDYLFEITQEMTMSPWNILCEAVMLLFMAYLRMGQASFYDIYSGNLIFKDAEEITDVQEI